MLPDKRRAGRAIRKTRREQRERLESVAFVAEAFVAFGKALEAAAKIVWELLEPLIILFATPRRQYAYWLARSQAAAELSEAYTGDPSHSGGQALRTAPGASDEPVDFGPLVAQACVLCLQHCGDTCTQPKDSETDRG